MIIWIDDIKSPPPELKDMVILLRSKEACREFLHELEEENMYVSLWNTEWVLDHDLGLDDNGNPYTTMDFLKELHDLVQDYAEDCIDPKKVQYITQNPQGKADMIAFIESWAKSMENQP